jgi:hypothetical protein
VDEEKSVPSTAWKRWASNFKLIGEALQPFAIIVGGAIALVTYLHSVSNDRDLRERELSRAFYEKQLDLYLESSRIAARLAAVKDDAEREKNIARFWELYWGELALVESRAGGPCSKGTNSIESLMVGICTAYVSKDDPDKCHAAKNPDLASAINLAHQASDEVRERWQPSCRPEKG